MAYCCARRKALGGLLLAGITVGTGVVGWKRFAAAPVELPEAEVCLDAPPFCLRSCIGAGLERCPPDPCRCPLSGVWHVSSTFQRVGRAGEFLTMAMPIFLIRQCLFSCLCRTWSASCRGGGCKRLWPLTLRTVPNQPRQRGLLQNRLFMCTARTPWGPCARAICRRFLMLVLPKLLPSAVGGRCWRMRRWMRKSSPRWPLQAAISMQKLIKNLD